MPSSYTSSAEFYDAIYTATKEYEAEAQLVMATLLRAKRPLRSLLDVACGTGLHLQYFVNAFESVAGIDLSENQLAIARQRLPKVRLVQADMLDFEYDKVDAITCLFSAIGYMTTYAELETAIRNMASHLNDNGIVVIEPWILPSDWQDGLPHMQVVDTEEFKLVRMNRSTSKGNRSVLQMHYLVLRESDEEPEHFVERHILTMHSKEEYLSAMAAAGLNAWFEPNDYRGYFVGIKRPLS